MFLYSINGLLLSQSLNRTTIEKYLPYGSSLSLYLAIERLYQEMPLVLRLLVDVRQTDLRALTFS